MSQDKNAELNNLRYKTGCLRATSGSLQHDPHTVDQILENESSSNTGKPWQRLNRTERVAKLRAYAEARCTADKLSPDESASLISTLLRGLENRRLGGARDVVYDAATGKVVGIPALAHSPCSKRFTLKRSDRRVSTTKSLGQGNTRSRKERRKRSGENTKPKIESIKSQSLKDN